MSFFDFIHTIGKKVSGVIHKGFTIGQKIVSKVGNIASKVLGMSKYVKPFIPAKYRGGVDKALSAVKTARTVSSKVSSGIERAKELEGKAKKVSDVSSGVNLLKETYYAGKNALSSTRSALQRPVNTDNTSTSKVITGATKPTDRAKQRAMPDKGLVDKGRGIRRSNINGEVQKAIAMARSAQKLLSKPPKKGGILRK